MCGIVACHTRRGALDYIVPALERLEYRGYDSAGVAVSAADGSLRLLRSVGRLKSLKKLVAGYDGPTLNGTGIGHTRWATHGVVSERNAHPHLSCDERVAIVHNGIIDNAAALRTELETAGHRFRSDVDSEVVAHLIEHEVRGGVDLLDAVCAVGRRLNGSWAIAVLERDSGRLVDPGTSGAAKTAAAPAVDPHRHNRTFSHLKPRVPGGRGVRSGLKIAVPELGSNVGKG